MIKRFKKILRRFFLINDSPRKIAAGAALGIFLGIIPGAGIAAAILISSLLRWNRLATTTAVLAVNTWITFFIAPLAAIFGGFLFDIAPSILINDFRINYELGWKNFLSETIFSNLLLPLMVGFFIVSFFLSLGIYFLLYYLLEHKKIEFR